jgi:hypothetical protein
MISSGTRAKRSVMPDRPSQPIDSKRTDTKTSISRFVVVSVFIVDRFNISYKFNKHSSINNPWQGKKPFLDFRKWTYGCMCAKIVLISRREFDDRRGRAWYIAKRDYIGIVQRYIPR